MSATRPASELSIGIMAKSARPSKTAAKQSSKVAQGIASAFGKTSRLAMCELAPGSPWKATFLLWGMGLVVHVPQHEPANDDLVIGVGSHSTSPEPSSRRKPGS